MAALLIPLAWAPIWRSQAKREKFMSGVLAYKSPAAIRTDLKLRKYSTIAHSF